MPEKGRFVHPLVAQHTIGDSEWLMLAQYGDYTQEARLLSCSGETQHEQSLLALPHISVSEIVLV